MGKSAKIGEVTKGTELMDSRSDSDTLKLWENYREQAALWRALALFQIPACLLLIVFSTILWATRTITLSVPSKPLPGIYAVKEIPDTEFVQEATNFVNLIASYQPYVARRQFARAREMLVGQILESFDTDMMSIELQAIENTSRSQIFYADPTRTTLDRTTDRSVSVSFTGERIKYVAGKELPLITTKFTVTLSTIPRHTLNPFGIVVTNVNFENIEKKK